ncbi:TPA: M14 family metallopeptidase [Streptococcus suis]
MGIDNYLKVIKEGVFGRDVRQAIHDGIEQAYEDATANDNANMEVAKARGIFDTLPDRLNSITSVSINTNMEVVKARGTYSNLKLRLDAEADSIRRKLDNVGGAVDVEHLSQNVKEMMTGGNVPIVGINAVDTINTRDEAITPAKTTFINTSNNLYNYSTSLPKKRIDENNGQIVESQNTILSDYIAVTPSIEYCTNVQNGRIVYFTKSGNFISSILTSSNQTVFTPPQNAEYIRLVAPESSLKLIIVNKGSVLTDNPYYYTYLNPNLIKKMSIESSMIKPDGIGTREVGFIKKSSNLFDYTTSIISKTINSLDGNLIENSEVDTSSWIQIEPDTVYTFNEAIGIRYTFYDIKKQLIQSVSVVDPLDIVKSIVSPPNAYYLRLSYQKNKRYTLQLNVGSGLAIYEPFYEKIDEKLLHKPIGWSLLDIPTDYNAATVEALDGTGNFLFDLKVEKVYQWMDALMDAEPGYITKEILGKDQSGTYDILSYTFRPENIFQANNMEKMAKYPTILITLGTHGNGNDAGDKPQMHIAALQFLGDLVRSWQGNDALSYIRNNVILKVIPVVNPWGIDNKSRRNSRQVDINRNFDLSPTTGSSSVVGSNTYRGTEPYSESETRIVRDWVLANKNAIAHTDFHSAGGIPAQDRMIYFDIHHKSMLKYPARDLIKTLSAKWNSRGYSNLSKGLHGYLLDQPDMPTMHAWVDRVAGIPSTVLEGFAGYQNSTYGFESEKIMEMVSDEFGTWILYVLKFLKEI